MNTPTELSSKFPNIVEFKLAKCPENKYYQTMTKKKIQISFALLNFSDMDKPFQKKSGNRIQIDGIDISTV